MQKQKAYTLAEIIITIILLGVLAAIIIPSTIKNHHKKITITRLKIAYSLLIKLAETSSVENSGIPTGSDHWNDNDWDKYVKPYLKIQKDCGMSGYAGAENADRCFAGSHGGWYTAKGYEIGTYESKDENGNVKKDENGNTIYEYSTSDPYSTSMFHKVILINGMSLAFAACDACASAHNIFIVDVDGPHKGYSILGQDVFMFEWVNAKKFDSYRNSGVVVAESTVVPYVWPTAYWTQGGWYSFINRRISVSDVANNCKGVGGSDTMGWGVNGGVCAAWIIANDWKFPADYPFNLNKKPDRFVPLKN